MSLPNTLPTTFTERGAYSSYNEQSFLLSTKLYVARTHTEVVLRSRLHTLLDQSLGSPLTLIVGPAGFGKTTLVAQWLASSNVHAAWLSLDTGENDAATFLRYIVAALRTVAPQVGTTLLTLLNTPQPPLPETLIKLLINDVVALSDEIVLVLDDYHVVHSAAVHHLVRLLIERLPPQMHLILTTREDPPLPLSRYRVRRQMIEIRATDLRFNIEEATAFLRDVMLLPVSPEQIAALEARTEGWIAGLHLVALALQERRDVAHFVANFRGSHHFIIDYLIEEVIGRLPQHLRDFVLQISVLERFCAPLCDALVLGKTAGSPYSQLLLDKISSMNLFVIPLDHERHWYRFHHLFAEVLRERLEQSTSQKHVALLHQRASQWHAEHGLFELAIKHALAAGDVKRAVGLVEQQVEALTIRSEIATTLSLIALLPPAVVDTRPILLHVLAAANLVGGNIALVEHQLARAESLLTSSSIDQASGDSADHEADIGWFSQAAIALRSILARAQGDLPQAIALGQAALNRLPKRFRFLRSTAAWNLGMAYWMIGDLGAAGDTFREVIDTNQSPEYMYGHAVAVSSLGQLLVVQGKLHEAEHLYRQFLDHISDVGARVPSVAMVYVSLGDVLRERNELQAAIHYLTIGIQLGQQFASADVLVNGYVALARVEQACGSAEAVAKALASLQQLTPGAVFGLTGPQHIRLLLALDDINSIQQWTESKGVDAEAVISPASELDHLVLARLLLKQQSFPDAIGQLEELVENATAGERYGSALEARVLLALAYAGAGRQAEAIGTLDQAMALAEPQGFVRLFVDEGEPMRALLHATYARGIQAIYCERLLAAFPREHANANVAEVGRSGVPTLQRSKALSEPLNEREMEVLQLIAQGLSNREIADRLVVALSTVKWHINHLYDKLEVSTRTQALVRAAELQLL